MTVTAPPRPPRPGDPVNRDELEALVEALIEEARRRARRRRRRYGAGAVFLALVGPSGRTEIDVDQRPFDVSPLSFNWL